MTPYEKNDTLIFQNVHSLDLDTTIITDKEVYHPSFQPIARSNIPHTARIWYYNKQNEYNDVKQMLEMYKDDPNEPAFPLIKYLGISIWVEDAELSKFRENLSITNKEFKNVYIFGLSEYSTGQEKHMHELQTIFWDQEYGLIKYITYNQQTWERINFD